MKYFTAIYMAPASEMKKWMQKPEAERRVGEENMKKKWDEWTGGHKDLIQNTIALGKTKRVNASGVEDTRNDMMLSSYVAAESLEAAAEAFKDHPHLTLPGATIEIMETRPM